MEGKKWHRGWTRGRQSEECNEKKGLSCDLFHQRCMRCKKFLPELDRVGSNNFERVVFYWIPSYLFLVSLMSMCHLFDVLNIFSLDLGTINHTIYLLFLLSRMGIRSKLILSICWNFFSRRKAICWNWRIKRFCLWHFILCNRKKKEILLKMWKLFLLSVKFGDALWNMFSRSILFYHALYNTLLCSV